MTLKDIILGRAEDLSEESRRKFPTLPSSGAIIIEIHNSELNSNIISLERIGGFSNYLRNLAPFKEIDIGEGD